MVSIAVRPREGPQTLFLPVSVSSFKFVATRPVLHPFAALLVILPEAAVHRAVKAIVKAESVGFVVEPLTLIKLTIFVQQTAIHGSFVILEVAFVERPV